MKAYVYGANGPEITDVARPVPKGTQVLVKVHACGLNRADLGMTKGHAHGAAGGVGTVLGMNVMTERSPEVPDEVREQAPGLDALYAVHGIDGERLALVRDRHMAFMLARQNELNPVSVH